MRSLTDRKPYWIAALICLSLILAACGTSATPTAKGGSNPSPTQPAGSYPPPLEPTPTFAGYPAPGQAPQVAPTNSAAYPAPAGSIRAPAASGQLILVKPDGTSAAVNLTSLQSLTLTQVSSGGQVENGYKLADILKAAGVSQFQQVTVFAGEKSAGFTSADLPADAVLSFADPNNITLAASTLPVDQWLKGVTRVEVK